MNSGYAAALFISAAIASVASLVSWRRRHSAGATGLALATSAMSVWALTYAIMWISTTPQHVTFWLDMTYIGVVGIPPALLMFALEHTRRADHIRIRNAVLILTIPVLTLVVLWTDPLHNLFYGGERASTAIFSGGPWFWVSAIYGSALLLVVLVLLAQDFLQAPSLYRKQSGAILAAVTLPLLVSTASLITVNPLSELDLTPIAFTIAGSIITVALFKFGMLEIVPVARGKLVDSMADGVIVLDIKGRLIDLNPSAGRFFHIDKSTLGTSAEFALPAWCMRPATAAEQDWSHEEVISASTGKTIEIRWTPLLRDGRWNGDLITLRDITQRALAESALSKYREELERLAVTDELTGLANRRKAIETLEQEFGRSSRTGSPLSVAMLDIDDFKSINDSFGHAAGDEVLAEVAHRLSNAIRGYDLVARIGGEEFLVVAPATDREGALVLAERLRKSISQSPFQANGDSLNVTISVGVSSAIAADEGIDPVLARADQALYDAKHRGRDRVVVN